MSQKIVKYLKAKMPFLDGEIVEKRFNEAKKIYAFEKGALGLTEIDKGFWRIDFFAADDKETRNLLIERATTENDIEMFVYQRAKHDDKTFWHTRPFFKRLMAI